MNPDEVEVGGFYLCNDNIVRRVAFLADYKIVACREYKIDGKQIGNDELFVDLNSFANMVVWRVKRKTRT